MCRNGKLRVTVMVGLPVTQQMRQWRIDYRCQWGTIQRQTVRYATVDYRGKRFSGRFFQMMPNGLPEGNYSVTATAQDTAGNSANASDSGVIDVTAPTLTVDAPAPTNDSTPTITGTTNLPAGSTVALVITDANGAQQTVNATVQANGSFSVDVPNGLPEGNYPLVLLLRLCR